MQSDPWQQWQAMAALFSPGVQGSQPGSAHGNAPPSAPFAVIAERFGAAARVYLDAASHAPPAAAEAARAFGDHLREIFADFQLPWNAGFGSAAGSTGTAPAFAANAPALGATREHQQRWQRIADAWRRLDDAQRRLQRFGSDALRDAAAAFTARLGAAAPTAAGPEVQRKLYDAWIDCAEDAYARAAHSESFCNTLAEYVNASSEWRRDLQATVEQSAKLFDLPTRSEINTLNLRVKSLEEELRAVRDARKPEATAPKTAARKAAARKAAAHKTTPNKSRPTRRKITP
ncbi:MAG TPA: poly(R)-hydroxyalkanoic acid synthase subunit PhaE [Steroidobacteraceae bacterium]|nr:poly(R)-hydroxyalkanoic acid synthase subunit PhaE [Steroidobacteraceae bacterium]